MKKGNRDEGGNGNKVGVKVVTDFSTSDLPNSTLHIPSLSTHTFTI